MNKIIQAAYAVSIIALFAMAGVTGRPALILAAVGLLGVWILHEVVANRS